MSEVWVDEGTVDLRQIVRELWARRWLIVAVMALSTALFATIAFTAQRVYRATTVVISTSSERSSLRGTLGSALAQVGGLASLAGINVGSGDSSTEEALAVLTSRQFTERFISELNLMPLLFEEQWDESQRRWKGELDEQPTLAQAYKYFNSEIRRVSRDRQTNLVTVQIEWPDRELAAAWANELVSRLNAEMRARAIEKAEASLEFLEKELEATALVGTREAINRLVESEIRDRMLANVTHEFAFRVVDPALPPDPTDPIRPNKLLLLLMGPMLGFGIGVVAALVLRSWRRRDRGADESVGGELAQ
jgi:uncharacterized protein involved in exopolysaccharide biosynthesis